MEGCGRPRWPESTHGTRVLVECDDDAVQDGMVRTLRDGGFVVAACAGPGSRPANQCPLTAGAGCGLVEDADVVVHALDEHDAANRAVADAITERAIPLVVDPRGMTGPHLVDEVRRVVRPC